MSTQPFPDSFVLDLADAVRLMEAVTYATGPAKARYHPYREGTDWTLLRGRLQAYIDRLRERDQPPSSASGPHLAILEEVEPGILRVTPVEPTPTTVGHLAALFATTGVVMATATRTDNTWAVVCTLHAHNDRAMVTERTENPILARALSQMVAILEARERRVK